MVQEKINLKGSAILNVALAFVVCKSWTPRFIFKHSMLRVEAHNHNGYNFFIVKIL